MSAQLITVLPSRMAMLKALHTDGPAAGHDYQPRPALVIRAQ